MEKKGFLVAADERMEWLLPWWWKNYSISNHLPVAFVDLGLSEKARSWCLERGHLFSIEQRENDFLKEVPKEWSKNYGVSYELARKAWFQKPLACLLTPFEETVWMDLDCEVLDPLDGIFECLKKEMAIRLFQTKEGWMCNSGVVVFRKESLLIKKWAELALSQSDQYWGDDRILWELMQGQEEKISLLPEEYHWRLLDGVPIHAKVIHWLGEWGKLCIQKHGGLRSYIRK